MSWKIPRGLTSGFAPLVSSGAAPAIWTSPIAVPVKKRRRCDVCGKLVETWYELKNPRGRNYYFCRRCYEELFNMIAVYVESGKVRT